MAVDIFDHVHAFEHGLPVILHQNWNDALADELDHGVGIIVEDHGLLQMQPLERRDHAHSKAERAVLEHVNPHHTLSFLRLMDARDVLPFIGLHCSARPWQQLSVK